MDRQERVIVKATNNHDCRSTGKSYEVGDAYVLPREKAEMRQKQNLVVIVRRADKPAHKAAGNAPENKAVANAPENKTLAGDTRKELAQLADGMRLKVSGSANKQQIIEQIITERQRVAAADKEARLDAED